MGPVSYSSETYDLTQVELSGYYEAENTTPSLEGYFCFNPASSVVGNQGDPFRKVFMPLIYLLMFVLGTLGNALVLVILERFKRSRTTTENFLFHLTLANLALLLTFPFSVVESLSGWVFGKFLCKILSAVHKINFYCSSMLLGCIAVDRYLAIVYAIHTYRKRRARSVHLTCTAVWLCSLLLTLPDLIFMEVWTDDSNRSICYFPEVGIDGNNAWLATRFLYHTVGFFMPLLVMCYCYMAIIRALCQSQRLQRQKAVRVAILVTGIFLLCWSPYHIVIFLNTLTKLETFTKNCLLEDQLDTAIMVTEAIGFTHCCLNPILYAFIGVKFRNDFFRILQELGCISQETLQEILEVTRKGSGIESDNTPPPSPLSSWERLPAGQNWPRAFLPSGTLAVVSVTGFISTATAFFTPQETGPIATKHPNPIRHFAWLFLVLIIVETHLVAVGECWMSDGDSCGAG
ncbi:hypothetical protein DUI87_31446 [Hirundo rustica rustica]|uniref:C-X-C chemokine receptor type 5 n=1 Tax=Hirundo rustica rustica TaxID=333673 RepID=A0A3M0IU11_HIRRU|nr:hypothetical protein DUI87_31446 [Hirundo rustica rustica]